MVGWHHRLDGHGFEQAPGVDEGQGSLACCSPWGCKKLDTTEQLTLTELSENKHTTRDFPSGPGVKTWPSHVKGMGLIPGQGAKILHALSQETKT